MVISLTAKQNQQVILRGNFTAQNGENGELRIFVPAKERVNRYVKLQFITIWVALLQLYNQHKWSIQPTNRVVLYNGDITGLSGWVVASSSLNVTRMMV